jgi:hypothetical protein
MELSQVQMLAIKEGCKMEPCPCSMLCLFCFDSSMSLTNAMQLQQHMHRITTRLILYYEGIVILVNNTITIQFHFRMSIYLATILINGCLTPAHVFSRNGK